VRSRNGNDIEGVLLADGGDVFGTTAADARRRALERAHTPARAGRGSAGGVGWPAWIGGAVALAALLGAGVALELVPTRRLRLVYS
jgi:hypothetical protein